MATRGWKHARLTGTACVAAIGLLVVACGNDQQPAADTTPTTTPTASTTPSTPTSTPKTKPSSTATPKPSLPPKRVRLSTSMLLTGSELSKGDPNRGWAVTSGSASTPICGNSSTRGKNLLGSLNRNFSNGLDASGGQWLTRYEDNRAASAAYERITATIESCKALVPAPTHARKLTENRSVKVGDATRILRWYDYPLPSDPGSEDGGFPYAVTVKGSLVSVLAFREMGQGIRPTNFEHVAVSAAKHLAN